MAKTLVLTSDRGPRFELGAGKLRRMDGNQHQEIALAEVVRVRAGRLGRMGTLEIVTRSGAKLLVISDTKPKADGSKRYREFVEAIHRQLVDGGTAVEYVGGLQIAPALSAIAAAGMLVLAWANPMHYSSGKIIVIYVIGVLALVGGIVITITNRKQFYDPLAIPPHYLP